MSRITENNVLKGTEETVHSLEEDFLTPRSSFDVNEATKFQLIDDDEDDDDEDVFAFSKRSTTIPSRSGAWSSFSWSSLYDRKTESSLSWADDELEKDTTDKVAGLFRSIDDALYSSDNYPEDDPDDGVPLSDTLLQECQIWKKRYPHLRIVGKAIRLRSPEEVPKDDKKKKKSFPLGVSRISNTFFVQTSDETCQNEEEEVLAADGNYIDPDRNIMEGFTVNERFERNAQEYFEEKVMTAVFRKVWQEISEDLVDIVEIFGDRFITDSIDLLSISSRESSAKTSRYPLNTFNHQGDTFKSIDENSVMNVGNGFIRPILGQNQTNLFANDEDTPTSLPNLSKGVVGSSALNPKKDEPRRPVSSQTPRNFTNRSRRANSFKADRIDDIAEEYTKVKTGLNTETSGGTRSFLRMRSQSGSPPRVKHTTTPSTFLPPIRITSAFPGNTSSRSKLPTLRATSGNAKKKLSNSNTGKSPTTLNPPTTPRDLISAQPSRAALLSARPKIPSQNPNNPVAAARDERPFSITGRRLKSLNDHGVAERLAEAAERSSMRLSSSKPLHWDAKSTITTKQRVKN